MGRLVLTSLLVATLAACAGHGQRPLLAGLPEPGDAPYDLSDDDDLVSLRQRYDVVESKSKRSALRGRLIREYHRRSVTALRRSQLHRSYLEFTRMMSLWRPRELKAGLVSRELREVIGHLRELRATYARAGLPEQTVGVLHVLADVDREHRAQHRAEIREIFSYTDDLYEAEYGAGAARAQPIDILDAVARYYPSPRVSADLVKLLIARQRALDHRVRSRGASFNLIRAHGPGVLKTTWSVIGILARTEQLSSAPIAVAAISGIGDDPELKALLIKALTEGNVENWRALAAHYSVSEDADKRELDAALAILEAGMQRHPKAPELLIAAGDIAFSQQHVPRAVDFYERAFEHGSRDHRSGERLAALYENQVVSLALDAKVREATERLSRFEAFQDRARKLIEDPITPDLADAYAAMGQGLVTLGDLDRAARYLDRSIDKRPSLTALEYRGLVDLRQLRADYGYRYFERALGLELNSADESMQRNRIQRLAGEARAAAGQQKLAGRHFRRAISSWQKLLSEYELNGDSLAELMLETTKLYWYLGDEAAAVDALDAALSAANDNAGYYAEGVAFMLAVGRYREALAAYHLALPNQLIGDDIKVYMSLWLLAEARFRGSPIDPFVIEALQERTGATWIDKLAALATGKVTMSQLRRLATTRRKQSELLFYSAVLSHAPSDPATAIDFLRRVREGSMILDFEFELAGRWLDRLEKKP